MAELKVVKTIGQKEKDIVYGYIKPIQAMFPPDNPYFTIDQLIQDLCLLYYRTVIDTEILTNTEQTTLIEMINNHTNNKYNPHWKLLFRGSRDGLKRNDFYKKCNGKSNTICIIQSPQNNVFGGFTSLKLLKLRGGQATDITAFVYLIRSNGQLKAQLFPVQNGGKDAIQYYYDGYLSFGPYGEAIFMGADNCGHACYKQSVEYNLAKYQLNGTETRFEPVELELFQMNEC